MSKLQSNIANKNLFVELIFTLILLDVVLVSLLEVLGKNDIPETNAHINTKPFLYAEFNQQIAETLMSVSNK